MTRSRASFTLCLVLLVPLSETGKQHLFQIGFAVAVGVLCIQNVGGCGDQHPFLPGHHAVGEVKSVEKQRRFIVFAVSVSIFEETHSPATRPARSASDR